MGSERKDKLARYLGPAQRRQRRRRRWRGALWFLVAFLVLTALDIPLARLVYISDREPIQNSDIDRLLRVVGSFWTWLVIMWIVRRHDRVWDRAGSLFFAPMAAGLSCEGVKLMVARERPALGIDSLRDGWYSFRGLFSGFSDATNLGFPSSHTAVAFAGCMVLGAWMPRARWIFIGLGVGCGLARMVIGAHYATDILVGGAIGWAWARFFEPVEAPEHMG